MELVLPSLIILLLSAFFIFMVLPRTGPLILAVVSVLALVGAGIQHYSMFSAEYRFSTWQNTMTAYAPFVVLGLALITILAAAVSAFYGNVVSTVAPIDVVSNAISNMKNTLPSASSATNMVTAGINKGLAAIAPIAHSVANAPPAAGPSLIPNLGYRASEV
jgi:hypothetical protein